MALPACRRCGTTDPARMIGLMTIFFGEFVEISPEAGYFYLCPECYETEVEPYLDEEQIRVSLTLEREPEDGGGSDPRDREGQVGKLTE